MKSWILDRFYDWVMLTPAKRTTYMLIFIGSFIVVVPTVSFIIVRSSKLASEKVFSVENIDNVTEIEFLAPNDKKVIFTKTDTTWLVNNAYPAKARPLSNLLYFISNFEFDYPVDDETRKEIAKQIKEKGVLVNIYNGFRNIQSYYVGEDVYGSQSTYMMKANSSHPYAVKVKGYDQSFGFYFHTQDFKFREQYIFPFKEITGIKLNWFQDADDSFSVTKDGKTWLAAWKNSSREVSGLNVLGALSQIRTAKFDRYYYDKEDILTNPKIADINLNFDGAENVNVSVFKYVQLDTLGGYYFNPDTSIILSSSYDRPLIITNIELNKFLFKRNRFF